MSGMFVISNKELDFYVCPMGQHLGFVKQIKEKSDLKCPLRGMCYYNAMGIEINHRNNVLRAMARELLTSDEGQMHRSRRQIEPEVVFGQIKSDNHFKRFRYRGKRLLNAEFATIAVAHNIRKMISKLHSLRSEAVVG